jgi:hypothetical protein
MLQISARKIQYKLKEYHREGAIQTVPAVHQATAEP